jgi:hypothetical protein
MAKMWHKELRTQAAVLRMLIMQNEAHSWQSQTREWLALLMLTPTIRADGDQLLDTVLCNYKGALWHRMRLLSWSIALCRASRPVRPRLLTSRAVRVNSARLAKRFAGLRDRVFVRLKSAAFRSLTPRHAQIVSFCNTRDRFSYQSNATLFCMPTSSLWGTHAQEPAVQNVTS